MSTIESTYKGTKMTKLKSIELFAGCGGMSLGFKSENYDLLFANELSPMASETFALNFFAEDLKSKAMAKETPENVFWLSSQYPKDQLSKRLNEQPLLAQVGENRDFDNQFDLKNKLLVGSILELNTFLKENPSLIPNDVDVVSGGPPCQSFSMSGLRKKDDPKNQLPFAFAEFVSMVKPKFVVLENVTGILRPFKDTDGKEYHAWVEISKCFAQQGYVPICLHINAKFVGVPQSRPRFILCGIRHDVAIQMREKLSEKKTLVQDLEILKHSFSFFDNPNGLPKLYDIHQIRDQHWFDTSFLSFFKIPNSSVCVRDAIDDLVNISADHTYRDMLNSVFVPTKSFMGGMITNQDVSKMGDLVLMRSRLYQILETLSSTDKKQVRLFLQGTLIDLPKALWEKLLKEIYLQNGKLSTFASKDDLCVYLSQLKTKKRTQQALNPDLLAPTLQSIAEEIIHYSEIRPINVREMARLQSFPDWFEFRAKRTTGGNRRKFEIPQQTQIGNAVPPLLAKQIAKMVSYLNSL